MQDAIPFLERIGGNGRGRQFLAWGAVALAAFLLGFFFELITFRLVFFVILGALGTALLALPYKWSICFLFIYLGFDGMAKIVTGYNPVVHVGVDILMLALCTRWFFSLLLRRAKLPAKLPPLAWFFIAHFIWFLIQFLNPYALSLVASIAGFKVYITMVVLYFFGYYLTETKADARRFMLMWIIVAAIQVVTSLIQSYEGPVSVLAISPYYAAPLEKFRGYAFRPFGTTAVAGAPAVYISIVFPFIMYFFTRSRNLLSKLGVAAFIPTSILAILVCQVRAALFKAILGAFTFLVLGLKQSSARVRLRMLGFVVFAAVLLAVAMPKLTSRWVDEQGENRMGIERTMSLFDYERMKVARGGAWDRILMHMQMVPLGAGLSRTGAAAGKFQKEIDSNPYMGAFFTDNLWAALLVDLGIPGTLIITALLGLILLHGLRAGGLFRDRELTAMNGAIFSALLALTIGFWGVEGLLYNPEAAFYWFFSGMLLKLPELDEPEPGDV